MVLHALNPSTAETRLPQLIALLQDAVASGASIGFLPPLDTHAAEAYWRGVLADNVVLFVAEEDGNLVGTVQLAPATKANALHRAEVQKLMVHRDYRSRGIGRRLMELAEQTAKEIGSTLLVLDTRRGDVASTLYRKLGYIEAGVIPRFALSASGELDDTVLFYKEL